MATRNVICMDVEPEKSRVGLKKMSAAFILLSGAMLSGCFSLPRPFPVQVINADGDPVEGATIELISDNRFLFDPGRRHVGESNTKGIHTFFGLMSNDIVICADKKGFYQTKTAGFRRFQVRVPIRKKVSPALTLKKDGDVELPSRNGVFFYDVIEADLVRPHGKGVHKDFRLELKAVNKKFKFSDEKINVIEGTFEAVGKNNGFIQLNVQNGGYPESFSLPHSAPDSGYFPTIEAAKENAPRDENDNVKPWHWFKGAKVNFRDSGYEYYIFRVRDGSKNGPLYGKIHQYHGFSKRGEDKASVSFDYYLNLERTQSLEIEREIISVKQDDDGRLSFYSKGAYRNINSSYVDDIDVRSARRYPCRRLVP